MKAFLAHSSEDKQFVSVTANRLTRSNAEIDATSFSPGYDLRDLIKNSISKSHLFVFFASSRSLHSIWTKFEINEAEWQFIHSELLEVITIIIDDEIDENDLPKWMKKSLIIKILNPRTAAHIIQNYLVQLDTQRVEIFVGRELEMAKFSRELISSIEKEPPRVFIIAGLEGIGRRTFGHHALKNYLNLNSGVVFRMMGHIQYLLQ